MEQPLINEGKGDLEGGIEALTESSMSMHFINHELKILCSFSKKARH